MIYRMLNKCDNIDSEPPYFKVKLSLQDPIESLTQAVWCIEECDLQDHISSVEIEGDIIVFAIEEQVDPFKLYVFANMYYEDLEFEIHANTLKRLLTWRTTFIKDRLLK